VTSKLFKLLCIGFLACDWQTVARLITADDSLVGDPVARLLAGHAYLATNKNNPAMLLFASLREPKALDAALKWAEDFATAHTNSPASAYLLGDALARSGRFKESISAFTRALELDPRFALAVNARGVARAAAGEQDAAQMDFSRAAELDPKLADAHANLGVLYLFQENGQGARSAFVKATDVDSSFALAYNGRACVAFADGEYDEALADLETAYEVCPGFLPAGINEAIVLAAQSAEAGPPAKVADAGVTMTTRSELGAMNLSEPSASRLDGFARGVERMSDIGEAFRTVSAQKTKLSVAQQGMASDLSRMQRGLKAATSLEKMFHAGDTILGVIPVSGKTMSLVPGNYQTWKSTLDLAGHSAGLVGRITQPGTAANMTAEVVSRVATPGILTGGGSLVALGRVTSYLGEQAMYAPKTVLSSRIGELCAKQQWANVANARLNGVQERLMVRAINEGYDLGKLGLVGRQTPITPTLPRDLRVYSIGKDAPVTQFGVLPGATGKSISAAGRQAYVLVDGAEKIDPLRLGTMLTGYENLGAKTLPVPRGVDPKQWANTLRLPLDAVAVVRITDIGNQKYSIPKTTSTGPPPGGVTTEFRSHVDKGNWPVMTFFSLAYLPTAKPGEGVSSGADIGK